MANYDAQINILVAGQRNIQNLANQLNAIEDSIGQIERRWRSATGALQRANIRLGVTGTQQPRGEGGRFARDPDRRARQLALQDRRRALVDQRFARLAVSRERAQAVAARSSIDNNETLIRQTEHRILLESRLNSANELFQRRVQQLSRGGGGRGLPEELQNQARSIQSAYRAAGGAASRNVRLIQSLATELGRVVERQNEFNRLQSLGSKGFEAGRRLQERITSAASGVDLPAQRVRNARSLATQVISASRSGDQQAYSEAVRRATAATSRLERESKELADAINEQESEIRRIARIAPRSPVRGGRNFPGSPIAEEIALKEAQKGFPASPIRGTATMAGSPKAIAAQERAAKIQRQAALAAERSAQKTLREAQKGYPSSPILGATSMEGSPRWMAAQKKARSAAERALKAQERAAKIAENTANKEAEKALRESQKGYPASPIAGTVSMTGSPRWLAAQEKARSAAERRVAAQRRTEERAAKVQQQVAIAAERAADKALREAQKGFPSSPVLGSATIEGSPRWRAAQESARQKLESAARAAERAADRVLKEAQKGFPSSPILGTATMVGSPKWKSAQEKMARMAGGSGAAGSGLEQALMRLQEARGARQAFLGGASPAEAIDKIVREFNQGKPAQNITDTFASGLKKGAARAASSAKSFATAATEAIKNVFGIASPSRFMIELVQNLVNTYIAEMQKSYPRIQAATDKAFGEQTLLRNVKELRATARGFEFTERPSRGFRPFREAQGFGRGTEGATQEFSNMMLDFRKQIAELTTQPEIFSNLLRGLPDARITTDLIGAANRRALASELPSFMPTQRMMGPGELEKAITNAFSKFVRELRVPASERIRAERFAGPKLLSPAVEIITPSQQERITKAYERSAQRALSVFAEDAFRGAGRPSLPAASFGFMADPARIGRLSGIGRALPPAIDVAASAADAGGRDLQGTVRQLFDRISAGVRRAVENIGGGFGGGAGRGGGAGGAGGGGGSAARIAQLLGLDGLADISRVSTRELEALSGVVSEFRAVLDPTIEGFDRLDNQLRETIAEIGRESERRAPDAGFLTRRFGPRTARGLSEGLIGGAFPLLFGQGAGAAIGGAAGGFGGGFMGGNLGFGLSLLGTALGTAFDTLSQAAQDTGAALNYPIEGFEKLKEAGLFASRQQEYYISKLIETGRTAEATAKIQARVVEVIGVQGANDLMALGDSASLLGKKWSELNYQMQALVAGPVGDFLELLAKVAGAKVESNRLVGLGERISQLTPEQRRIFQEEARKISAADYTKGAEALLDRIAPRQLRQAKEDPAQVERDLNKSIETAEKVRALRQQGTALERNAQDLRLSIEDTVYGLRKRAADMEREAAEFRRSVEDQVFSKRQELEQKLIENDRKRQQNAIDAFDLQLQRASTGLDPIAQGIVDAARQYLRIRAEGEADLQQNERQLKLQLQQIDQEVARYKLQVEDRISQMSIQRDEFTRDTAKAKLQLERQIGDYVIQVEEYRLAMAKHRYELEIDLEKKKQIAAQGGLMGGGGPVDQLMGAASQREKFVQDQLVRRGFTPEQMAAVMGSVRQESGFNPYAQEQGGTGLGLFQWSFDRRSKVPAFTGNWQKDIQNQLDLFQRELNTTEKKAGEILMGAITLQGAAAGMKQFERYGVAGRRYDYMKDYYTRFTGGTGVPVSQQMEPGFTETFDLNTPAPARPTTPTMPELPSAPQLVEVNDLLAQYVDLQGRIKKALEENNLAEARRIQLQAESARLAFERQTLSPIRQFQEQNRELQFEIEKRQLRNRLLIEGVKPEIAEGELRVLEINRALNSVLEGLEITTNEQIKAELERIGVSSDLVDSTFRLTEATLASLVATTQDVEKQEQLRKKLQEILDLRDKLAGKAKNEAGEAAAGARGIAAQQASDFQKAQDAMAKMKSDLDQLIDKVNQAKFASETFGNAFAGAITGSISAISGFDVMQERMTLEDEVGRLKGLRDKAEKDLARQREIGKDPNIDNSEAIRQASENYSEYKKRIEEARSEMDKLGNTGRRVREVLTNMLKGIGEAFVEMAQKIIAQQITMIIFGTILKALGIAAGASGGGGTDYTSGNVATDAFTGGGGIPGITKNPASIGTPGGGFKFANGAYFDNGIAAFAKGGMFTNSVVSSPTLFQFADGGVTRTGVMGEAGPEAIMPLERGADGKLGVKAKLNGAMTRYRRPPGTDAAAEPGSGDFGPGGGGAAVAAPIDVRYTVERINSVDYVTADQFQAGMAQAAEQGARRGEQRTLYSLRQNTNTRQRIGL